MKLALLLFASFVLTAGCASTGAQSEADKLAAAKELDARFLAAFNAGDVEAAMACYWESPELVSYPSDVLELRGWEAVRQGLAAGLESMAGVELRLVDMHYRVVGPAVIGWGQWRMKLPGMEQELAGRYTDVKEERDGRWVFVLDHVSVPMAAGE